MHFGRKNTWTNERRKLKIQRVGPTRKTRLREGKPAELKSTSYSNLLTYSLVIASLKTRRDSFTYYPFTYRDAFFQLFGRGSATFGDDDIRF